LDDRNKKLYLEVEFAAIVDAGKPFVQTTYLLEGDGPLALKCCKLMKSTKVQTLGALRMRGIAN
jgi:hypothetical protein